MKFKINNYKTLNGTIHIKKWYPDSENRPRAIIQILHGLMEHSAWYTEMAVRLTGHGYILIAHDARGHGKTAQEVDGLGIIPKNGWQDFIEDAHHITKEIQRHHPTLPIILLGHSMGAYVLQHLLITHPTHYHAAVLSGTTIKSPLKLKFATLLATLTSALSGRTAPAHILKKYVIPNYNAPFGAKKHPHFWLSKDPHFIAAYKKDPASGLLPSNGLYQELFKGMQPIGTEKFIQKLPKKIPYLFITGAQDPISRPEKAVSKQIQKMNSAGITTITHHLYPEGRHVMFQESNKAEVYDRLINWLKGVLKS